jgi:hypothetical protein
MFFSQGWPNIDRVIPSMDYLDQQLTSSALIVRYSESIKATITLGKKTLNRYYDMSDQSEIYRIAMGKCIRLSSCSHILLSFSVLHPRHKLFYFKRAGWKDSWITTARMIVCDVFDQSYADCDLDLVDEDPEQIMVCILPISSCV